MMTPDWQGNAVNGNLLQNKWSRGDRKWNSAVERLYNHVAYIAFNHHWNLVGRNPFECDDFGASPSSGDFWKVFVH